ncbi:hypothetical protein Y032_0016g3167 [Ancylostoma ceylanicum]|uniref:7TM GPCR serpentine receptor class x (Srx) domain-containing protein n=1 Tax=Ancylostoma ceylanicum TaxID=53326 RepID=A0A016V7E3_9BILA|nr:hypothetical protein Y032_0016g3167 [Ancylostoma ceylanicum]
MHVFYVSLPWIIDEKEYNCSSRSYSEWVGRGSVNPFQGTYFGVSGLIFVVLYGLCLTGMVRGHLLKITCYRLMFFNGIVDIIDLAVGSFLTAYFHFTGAVFCSTMAINWIAGHLSWSAWCGATFNCVVLALNRTIEMNPAMQRLRFLFKGKAPFFWMFFCVLYMIVRPFISGPIPYNTVVSSYLGAPMISDDIEWEISNYASLFLPIHNLIVSVILVTLYAFLCHQVMKIRRASTGRMDKVQIQLFMQSLLICATTAMTAILYSFLDFFPVSRSIVIAGNVVWQLSHGVHGVVYLCFNSHIRGQVLALLTSPTGSSEGPHFWAWPWPSPGRPEQILSPTEAFSWPRHNTERPEGLW